MFIYLLTANFARDSGLHRNMAYPPLYLELGMLIGRIPEQKVVTGGEVTTFSAISADDGITKKVLATIF